MMQYYLVCLMLIPLVSTAPVGFQERIRREVSDNVVPDNGNNDNLINMEDTRKVDKYLRMYGYMTDYPASSNNTANDTVRTEALRQLQTYFGIEVTGKFDTTTQNLMNARRCGCPDKSPEWKEPTKASFTVGFLEQKWATTLNVTWRITHPYTGNSAVNIALQRSEIKRAFDVWSEVANINFVEVSGISHITILFGRYEHNGGKGDEPFDGRGGVLAHAFFPEDGRVHFDSDEPWFINTHFGIDVFTVAAHEIGHAIGLGHSNKKSALMYSFYKGYDPNFTLDIDDIEGAQYLYGPSLKATTTVPTTPGTVTTTTGGATSLQFITSTSGNSGHFFIFLSIMYYIHVYI